MNEECRMWNVARRGQLVITTIALERFDTTV